MGALKSTRCSKGHLLKEPNLYFRTNSQRECKKCKELRNLAIKEKRLVEPKPRKPRGPRGEYVGGIRKAIKRRGGEPMVIN